MPIELGAGATVRVAPPGLPAVIVGPPSSGTATASGPGLPTVTTPTPAPSTAIVLPVAGPQGPEGPTGPSSGDYFEYVQSSPAATWIIDHNLGRRVQVTLLDVTGTEIHADVHHGSINQVSIVFPGPITGSAFIS